MSNAYTTLSEIIALLEGVIKAGAGFETSVAF
jgi:hypothetical protein